MHFCYYQVKVHSFWNLTAHVIFYNYIKVTHYKKSYIYFLPLVFICIVFSYVAPDLNATPNSHRIQVISSLCFSLNIKLYYNDFPCGYSIILNAYKPFLRRLNSLSPACLPFSLRSFLLPSLLHISIHTTRPSLLRAR